MEGMIERQKGSRMTQRVAVLKKGFLQIIPDSTIFSDMEFCMPICIQRLQKKSFFAIDLIWKAAYIFVECRLGKKNLLSNSEFLPKRKISAYS